VFESLDYVYQPSDDVARDVRYLVDVLGARLVFAIDEMGTRVAMVEPTAGPPRLLFAGHLPPGPPVLVYRVASLDAATARLRGRGWTEGAHLEIPTGPCVTFHAPGGQRFAVYERTRPFVEDGFAGRVDF
jgi:hypothetical protein